MYVIICRTEVTCVWFSRRTEATPTKVLNKIYQSHASFRVSTLTDRRIVQTNTLHLFILLRTSVARWFVDRSRLMLISLSIRLCVLSIDRRCTFRQKAQIASAAVLTIVYVDSNSQISLLSHIYT